MLGVSTATQLAERGVAVTLITDGALASGASGRSLSWLNSAAGRSPAYHRLRMIGIDRYRTLAAALPDAPWLRFDGGLFWGERADAIAAHHRAAVKRCAGCARWPASRYLPRPPTSTPARAGWIFRALVRHLIGRLTRPVGGCSPAWATPGPSSTATGCRAPGSRTGRSSTRTPSSWPPEPRSRTCSVSWACRSTRSTRPPLSSARDPSTSACGWWSTRRACRCGRPPTVASSSTPGGWTELTGDGRTVPEERVPELLAEASAVLTGHPALVADAVHAGPRPMPVDDEPVLGRVAGVAGLHVAFTHSGATLGLIAGELVADDIVTGTTHPLLDPYRADRFAGPTRTQLPGVAPSW